MHIFGNGQTMSAQTFEMSANCIGGHYARFFERVAFGNDAGQRRACNDKAAFFGGRKKHCEVVNPLFHKSDYSSASAQCFKREKACPHDDLLAALATDNDGRVLKFISLAVALEL